MPTISVSGSEQSDAGEINIVLEENHNATIAITGSHNLTVPFVEKLRLLAVGGDGLDGEIGANGRDGSPGIDGCDADRYRSGENGSPGEDGEHGYAGTHGGPAGNGGKVDVWVRQENLALLDAISTIDVSAGIPGKAGRHGLGGRGGRGGRGGSSYSWNEPYTVNHTEHWTDAEGNSHSRIVGETHHRHHYSSGGCNGRDGFDGGSYAYPLYPGAEGKAGQIYFHVMREMTTHHLTPYKLITRAIHFQAAENSGLWEPGDVITAFYGIENAGLTMMSPPELIPLMLENNELLELIQTGSVTGSIQPGTTHSNEAAPLRFRIREPYSHMGNEPYNLTAKINVAAHNIRLNQPYQHSWASDALNIQYPALLEAQSTHFSIAEHESHLLQATVKNIGAKALGKYAGRELFVEMTAVDTNFSLVSEHISFIEPQNNHQITYRERFKPGTELGEQQTYQMSLYLQPINRSEKKTLIQRQTITGQLSPKYTPPANKFILVINCNTSKQQLKYWTNFLGELSGDSQLAIWNTYYYQGLNLNGSPCLLDDAAHGTIIILDDLFPEKTFNKQQQNTQYITPEQLLKASQQYDVSLVSLGPKAQTKPYTHRDVVSWLDPRQQYASIKQLMDILLHEDINQPILVHQVTVPLEERWFCRGREQADEVLALVRTQLNNVFPNRTYHVSIASEEEQQVTISVRRLADTLEQNIHQVSLTDEQLSNPENNRDLIESGIIENLSFSQKLDLFMRKSNPYHLHLAQAITKDLLNESNVVMQTGTYNNWLEQIMQKNQRDFSLEFKKLRQLVNLLEQFVQNGDFENVQAWSPYVMRMIAQVDYHSKQHSSFWTRLIHWFLPQTNEQIIASSHALCAQVWDLQSRCLNIPIQEIKASAQREEQIINLAVKLKTFLQEYDDRSSKQHFCFFNKSVLSNMERKATQQLLSVCVERTTLAPLDWRTIEQSTKLKAFSSPFKLLFPEFTPEQSVVLAIH
ncbi:collagen-like protein [Legionella lytica]|uniref:Collagen-like protein n=1 Tax=Legionella lytica TaxID=96232 RepID=A0ABW8D3I0_9GAMM